MGGTGLEPVTPSLSIAPDHLPPVANEWQIATDGAWRLGESGEGTGGWTRDCLRRMI
jgi:hypothetical protein